MPGDRFSLAVGVSGQNQFVAFFDLFFQKLNVLLAFGEDMVEGGKIMIHVDGTLLAWQRSHVTVGSQDLVARAEKFFNGFRLCGRFDYYQGLCHESLDLKVCLVRRSCILSPRQP